MFESILDVSLQLNCDRTETLVSENMHNGIISSEIFEELGLEVSDLFCYLFPRKILCVSLVQISVDENQFLVEVVVDEMLI